MSRWRRSTGEQGLAIDAIIDEIERHNARLDELKDQVVAGRVEMLTELKSLAKVICGTPPEGIVHLRMRFKKEIKALVESIWLIGQHISHLDRYVHVEINYRWGSPRLLPIHAKNPRGVKPWDLSETVFREWVSDTE